jgi:hypothetical protein
VVKHSANHPTPKLNRTAAALCNPTGQDRREQQDGNAKSCEAMARSPSCAQSGPEITADAMADLKHIIPINAPLEKVYAAVATQAGMRSWWTPDTRMEEWVGGKAEFGFEKGASGFSHDHRPARSGAMRGHGCHGDHPEWNNTTPSCDLKGESDKGPTMLRFTHSGWREFTDYCISCNSM